MLPLIKGMDKLKFWINGHKTALLTFLIYGLVTQLIVPLIADDSRNFLNLSNWQLYSLSPKTYKKRFYEVTCLETQAAFLRDYQCFRTSKVINSNANNAIIEAQKCLSHFKKEIRDICPNFHATEIHELPYTYFLGGSH